MMNVSINTVPGMARMMIGVANSLGRKSVLDPGLSQKDGEDVITVLRIALTAYEGLIKVGRPTVSMNSILSALDAPERADHDGVKHQLVILERLYAPQPKVAS